MVMTMPKGPYRIHLDPIGGIAGDMFVAALVDAFPELVSGLLGELRKLDAPPGGIIKVLEHRDPVLTGRRFEVSDNTGSVDLAHHHIDYPRIRCDLRKAALRDSVREHALALFALLAEAEASVHGIDAEKVVFHEVGAWDSIVDFVAAGYIIDALTPAQWTCGPVPIGSGRIYSNHGILPIPAPATALLLRGMQVIDDGIPGERVTPTGAALLKYLATRSEQAVSDVIVPLIITASGNGFGQRMLAGTSNVLRCIAYVRPAEAQIVPDEEISVVTFEIDDQTAEDIAVALDRIRRAPGVLELFQAPVFGKKGRMSTQVQILVRPEHVDALADICFAETATLGLRFARVARRFIPRSTLSLQQPQVRVKLAERPDGNVTAKAEIDDLLALQGGRSEREQVRRVAEDRAIDQWREDERSTQPKD
jgi:uncharacterized protein (TIGR00299 family) protein